MNRTLLTVIGIAAVVIVGAIVFVVGSGGDDPEPVANDNVAANVNDADNAGDPPDAAPPAEDTGALLALEEWVEAFADTGIAISYGDTSVDGNRSMVGNLSIAAAEGVAQWSIGEAALRVSDGALVVQPSGAQTLTFLLGEGRYSIEAVGAAATIGSSDDGNSVIIMVDDVSSAAEDAGWTAGAMQIMFRTGEEQPASLVLTDIALNESTPRPYGPAISRLEMRFGNDETGENDGLVITGLALEWGALVLDASGAVVLDDAGFSGTLNAEIYDILTALDVYHAYDRFERDVLAGAYAALLGDVADNPDGPYAFEITIDNDTLTLEGEGRDMPDLPLEGVLPFLGIGTIQ